MIPGLLKVVLRPERIISIFPPRVIFETGGGLTDRNEGLGSTAILSVGLSPGITNLLVREASTHLDQVEEANITVMLGLGEKHGKAAVEWTVDHMDTSYEVRSKEGLLEFRV